MPRYGKKNTRELVNRNHNHIMALGPVALVTDLQSDENMELSIAEEEETDRDLMSTIPENFEERSSVIQSRQSENPINQEVPFPEMVIFFSIL